MNEFELNELTCKLTKLYYYTYICFKILAMNIISLTEVKNVLVVHFKLIETQNQLFLDKSELTDSFYQ